MRTGLFSHPACQNHTPPAGHPERPSRLEAVLNGLDGPAFSALDRRQAPPASRETISRAHSAALIKKILDDLPEQLQTQRYAFIDPDTMMSADSAQAALCAAGAVTAAIDGVMAREFDNAFCAVRPPGHHAERSRAMGFCLFNNIAIGALHARAVHGVSRIAVVDFDVHHGNGTQDIFFAEPNLFYASTHQTPLYPGTGSSNEHGVANNVVNCPLSPGDGSAQFQVVYRDFVLPALVDFAPELVLISAGFDGHRDDPLANLALTVEDFGWVTGEICAIAARTAQGRVVSALEGGYDLNALEQSAASHVRALMEA